MFIVEIMLAACVGTVTYVICLAVNQKPLAILAKMMAIFICVDIVLRVVVPVFYTVKKDVSEFKEHVESLEQKIDKVQKLPENLVKDKKGYFWEALDEQLNGPERRGKEEAKKK